MKTAVILAAGEGSRIWPYAEIRPKVMIPIANKPIIAHLTDMLAELGFEHIVIVGGRRSEQITHFYTLKNPTSTCKISVINAGTGPRGTAFSLSAAAKEIQEDRFLVLYGDTLLEKEDIVRLMTSLHSDSSNVSALVSTLAGETPQNWICCRLRKCSDNLKFEQNGTVDPSADLEVESIMGHPRGDFTHRFCAFAFHKSFLRYAAANSGLFTNVQVGMMPPMEGHLEMSLADWMADGNSISAIETQGFFIDIDKPWHILQANELLVSKLCGKLQHHELAEGAWIDDSAVVNGFVQLGPNSRIGKNVIIEGNLIVGSNTTIENGAILQGNHIIGNDSYIGNYCYLSSNSTVGNQCVINHCAELDGVIMNKVYLYHYMEFYGIIGNCTDLGAATVCGTLRFDDGNTSHVIKGRRETPRNHSNATYLGDYARTGVNAILMPGVKVGVFSVVGPGVLLQEDVPNQTMISLKQQLVTRAWGPERYGW